MDINTTVINKFDLLLNNKNNINKTHIEYLISLEANTDASNTIGHVNSVDNINREARMYSLFKVNIVIIDCD